jgi:acetylornithine/succinyldiaminopimelate/putrescine aminotransferase
MNIALAGDVWKLIQYRTISPDHFAAGTGLGCGFLPFDSFFLSLLPMIFSFGY